MGKRIIKPLSPEQRQQLLDNAYNEYVSGEKTLGQMIAFLRNELAQVNQAPFAKMCKISLGSLQKIEQDEGNQTTKTINLVLSRFNMKLAVQMISK